MTQLTNRFNIDDSDELLESELKSLPNSFEDKRDELSAKNSLLASIILHPIVFFLLWALITYAGYVLNIFPKPIPKQRDIEFVITQKEAPPINKNTKYRSDRNSRAGGKHDPKRAVSMPNAPLAPSKKSAASAPSAPKKAQPKQQVQKAPAQKPIQKQVQTPKTPSRPQPLKAPTPSVKPNFRPSATPPRTQAPKLSQAPKSPFSIEVPRSSAPVGPAPTFGSGSGTRASGGSSAGASRGSGMPSPQFSASKGSGSGSGSSSGSSASKGSGYSGGSVGNPGPGNPSGPPGIDAIKQPNWGPYMRDLESRIKRNWNPPKGDQSKRVVLLFKIGRDGRLLSVQTTRSSGQPLSDAAAKAAIELTAPFRPLPPEFKGSSIDIEFTFDYNVLGATYR